jgi:hypothetical protein
VEGDGAGALPRAARLMRPELSCAADGDDHPRAGCCGNVVRTGGVILHPSALVCAQLGADARMRRSCVV